MMERILIIKLGALGDFVQASLAMEAIREAHPEANLTLLTTPPYGEFAQALGLFDEIWTNGRPKGFAAHRALIARLRRKRFDRVYDLQTSSRSSWYFQLLRPGGPQWSGVAAGCSHPHANPSRAAMHTIERQAEQLSVLGLSMPVKWDGRLAPDLHALSRHPEADVARFDLPETFALLVPGGSAHRPAKRWPAAHYGELAARLEVEGIAPVLIGARAEEALVPEIVSACPSVRSLVGATSFVELAGLGARAALAVGNDTGPMHLIAATGVPCLALFSHESDPARCAPRGLRVEVIRVPDLRELAVREVFAQAAAIRVA